MKKTILFPLIIIVLLCETSSSFAQVNTRDSLALVDLHDSCGGKSWINKWELKKPVRSWFGVGVHKGRVDSLALDFNRMTGSIPYSIGNLDSIHYLQLSHDYVFQDGKRGTIPPTIGNLTNLEYLNLDSNQLIGSIPVSLGQLSKLKYLDLSVNFLAGNIPTELGQLGELQYLELYNNNFSGGIPIELAQLSNLQYLGLAFCGLSGPIPGELGQLTTLQYLKLSINHLSGNIPASLGQLSNLQTLDISQNQVSGSMPASLGQLNNLQFMILNDNQLTGNIPAAFGQLSNLQSLDLFDNQMSGKIPASIGQLSNLIELRLSNNQFSGSISSSLGQLNNLQQLEIANNQLSGSLPGSLGQLSNLIQLNLGFNQLSGKIPFSFGNLSNLQSLLLESNQLSDRIPSSLGKLSNLISLDLNTNQLSGPIPSSFRKLGNLILLYLDHNQLSDSLPLFLEQLPLQSLTFNDNKFTFAGVEQIVNDLPNLFVFGGYAPQAIIPLHLNGGKLSVSVGGTLANETFNWYRNGVLYKVINSDSAYVPDSIGDYYVAVTNSIAWRLTLYSDTIEVGVLPLKLLNFTAAKQNNQALLQWTTAQEINSSYFEIQRSYDDNNFTAIGHVAAAGNSNSINNYTYTDASPLSSGTAFNGEVYYRLKMMDKDGQFAYSFIRNINYETGFIAAIYPNPVKETLNLNFTSDKAITMQIEIINTEGKTLFSQQMQIGQGSSSQPINTSLLSKGVYYLKYISADGEKTLKFVKQ